MIDAGITLMKGGLTAMSSSQDPMVVAGTAQLTGGIDNFSQGLNDVLAVLTKLAEQAP